MFQHILNLGIKSFCFFQPPSMEAEDVVNLLDSFWFYPKTYTKIFRKHSENSSPPEPAGENQENPAEQRVPSKLISIHSRSRSHDHITIKKHGDPIMSSPTKPHLETIISQKEITREIPAAHVAPQMIKKTRKGSSKSLSELEFEEVRGFMDLGFVFSEEDKNSSLADILPGLHKFGQEVNDCDQVQEEAKTVRPYLSEAWEVLEKENKDLNNPLSNWRVPVVSNEIVMKDSLKWWAHAVASTVR